MSPEELDARIAAARHRLGSRLVILGHHYQRDEIVKFADFRGDSYKLSKLAAGRRDAEFIVFCGVHFMAESADVLSGEHQTVILPNLAAGCSMADMANPPDVLACWEALGRVYGRDAEAARASTRPARSQPVLPVTYMNSAASLKAFCGREGGAVCTSSNARAVVTWALGRAERVLFFPDEHLGRNTALALGFTDGDLVVWDPRRPHGGLEPEQLARARFILWRGWCSVHTRFTVDQIQQARAEHPGVSVIVHPECPREVVEAADFAGSTEQISQVIAEAPSGTEWAVGTEINLVRRLAAEMKDKLIWCLDPVICPCSTMYRIHPAYLCWVLEALVEGRVVNQVRVDPSTAHWARVALDRMLEIAG
jgi:quinolinate synthase